VGTSFIERLSDDLFIAFGKGASLGLRVKIGISEKCSESEWVMSERIIYCIIKNIVGIRD